MTERPRARGPQTRAAKEEHGFSLDELKEWKGQLEKVVHEHPILSASIAVGAGVLIARLLRDAFDEDERKRQRKRPGGLLGSEIGRAVMGSLATMAAAKLQETLLAELQQPEEEEEEEEAAPPRRRRPTKRGKTATGQGRRPPRRRKPVEE